MRLSPKLFWNSLLLREVSYNDEPTCDDMCVLLNIRDSIIKLNLFDSMLLFSFIFLLDRT
jgi:hypothetical protein